MPSLREPVRTFALLLTLLLAFFAAPARAQDDDDDGGKRNRETLTVETSLGEIEDDGRRDLQAKGKAPRGAKLVIRFYRGEKRLATRKVTVRKRRYKAEKAIDRIGSYKVVVVATTRRGNKIRVVARLKYGPQAEAPTAPEPKDDE